MDVLDVIKIIILCICLPTSVAVLVRLIVNIKRFRIKDFNISYIPTDEAPSVSVCIPVRNEDHAIRDCLERVLASNYPKMEVIVLDDESVDKTPEIIKVFARDGVRFIKGDTLPEGWIGKNKANDQLVTQASGKYILFLSADTDIRPDSISRIVSYAMRHNLDMVGIMPIRLDGHRLNVPFGSLRYFWSVVFSRPTQPAQTTASWLVNRQSLVENGSFAKYKSTIMPEAKIAEDFAKKGTYQFVISDEQLGFSYEKRWSSQVETSIRILWPINVRSNFSVLSVLLMNVIIWLTLTVSIMSGQCSWVDLAILGAGLIFHVAYTIFAFVAWRKTSLLAFFTWPWAVLQALCCLFASLVRHKTNNLVWKGRTLTDHID